MGFEEFLAALDETSLLELVSARPYERAVRFDTNPPQLQHVSHTRPHEDGIIEFNQREQGMALESLSREFDRWKSGEIDWWELTDLIHRFHDGESRDLYKINEMGDIKIALARAIALGILGEEELPAALRESMQPTIAFLRGELAENEQHPDEKTR